MGLVPACVGVLPWGSGHSADRQEWLLAGVYMGVLGMGVLGMSVGVLAFGFILFSLPFSSSLPQCNVTSHGP